MSPGQVAVRLLSLPLVIAVSIALVGALLPVATASAQGGKVREYIVTLQVPDSGRAIRPSSKAARARISERAEKVKTATRRLARKHEFQAHHRYGGTFTGFSARMSKAQAKALAGESGVASIRPARTFKTSSQVVPRGVQRVLAAPTGGGSPDVDADVAVLDTGIGPADLDGNPLPMGPAGKPELNIAGGVNCVDDPWTGEDETQLYPGRWGDTHGHGTHVAGIIGARDNSVGTVGVAPGARLWSVRTFSGNTGSEAAILCGLDWVIATYSNANPDIDVLNMSIEGPRLDYLEDCDDILGNPAADPMHQGVCTATLLGISVVAAAGNHYKSANESSPGGYDQVISVGALSDFDGKGWGQDGTVPCSADAGERDDAYATWSNYGRDVDIIAPGVCINSTAPTTSGDATQTLSGTSQAAPHVTGAVARYLAGHPGTSSGEMRRLVRAAGRLDWDPRTEEQHWSGVGDDDIPHRVLDVAALMDSPRAVVWLYPDGHVLGGAQSAAQNRVDIQRRGGYSGDVQLSVTGWPSTAGSASFEQTSLSGLNALGTRLQLSLRADSPDGNYDLGVRASATGLEPHTRPLALRVDRGGPIVSNFGPRIREGVTMARNGATAVKLRWDVRDQLSSVASTRLQRRIGSGPWKDAGSVRVTLKPGLRNRFRVKATDNLGNQSTSSVVTTRLYVRDSASPGWNVPSSGWRTRSASTAYGGSFLRSNGATPSLTTTFAGKAVGVVASVGPRRGVFRVRVDGGSWTKVRTNRVGTAHRQVVWSRRMDYGTHTLEIQGVKGKAVIDAAVIIR